MDMAAGPVTLKTPLGEGVLLPVSLRGFETLSELFSYELELTAPGGQVHASDLLGQSVSLCLELGESEARELNGTVSQFELVGADDHRGILYRATLRPQLWLLSRGTNARIFQNLTVPEIVKQVLRDRGYSDFEEKLFADYPKRDFVVQYGESDYAFIARLLEEVGIYFFFRHESSRTILVLADAYGAHGTNPGYESLPYFPPDAHRASLEDSVCDWRVVKVVKPGAVAARDYNFEQPRADMLCRVSDPENHENAGNEVYEYPGFYVDHPGGETFVKRRLEQLRAMHEICNAETNARGLLVGSLFTLTGHPVDEQNREYLVTGASFTIRAHDYASRGPVAAEDVYRCNFVALDSKRPYRSPRRWPKPRIIGPQTAIVTGKDGEDIWTDQYGRIKVHFHWDRYGAADETSSCWIRVAHRWADQQWGSIHIPRIGQEVVVEFLDGDPDRPLVTGAVYNGDNMPPYGLPANQTQSGIKSRSTKKGGPNNFNEIRFEDKKGQEELFIQAEKTQTTVVKASQSVSVGGDQSITVTGNRSLTVKGKGKSPVHDETTVTGKHALHASDTIEMDAPTHIKLTCKGSSILIEPGKITLQAGDGAKVVLDANAFVQAKAEGNILVDANVLSQSKGGGSVLVDPNVTATSNGGTKVTLDGKLTASSPGEVSVGGAKVEITGQSGVTASGGGGKVELTPAGATVSGTKTSITGSALTEVSGAVVKIN